MQVFVITHCRDLDLLYGSTLVFGSLRLGFPNAQINVLDNASIPEARDELRKLAKSVGAGFHWTDTQLRHAHILGSLIASNLGTVVFIDPDVIFWETIEDWNFRDALAAGRLIPEFKDTFSGCLTAPRLHTSLLWLPDTRRLLESAVQMQRRHIDFDLLSPFSFNDAGRWRRFDTGASMYAAFKAKMHAFSIAELQAYDHLFCGSHLPFVLSHMPDEVAQAWRDVHEKAKRGDVEALRGIYRAQQDYFEEAEMQAILARADVTSR